MAKQKSQKPVPALNVGPTVLPAADTKALVSAPKLRAMLGISPVTLWRWRHDEELMFPQAREIKGRLYFQWGAVCAWYGKQPKAKLTVAS
jgi:predicted DNA-binding transcriptional regulator AlpA